MWGPICYSGRNTFSYLEDVVVYTFASPFFQIFDDGQHRYVLGSRPPHLGGGRIPAQRDIRQHEVFRERLERSPLLVAQQYKRQVEAMSCSSIRVFARRTDRDHSVVARYLRVLNLPDEVLTYLEENQTPELLRRFHVKRLVELGISRIRLFQMLNLLGLPDTVLDFIAAHDSPEHKAVLTERRPAGCQLRPPCTPVTMVLRSSPGSAQPSEQLPRLPIRFLAMFPYATFVSYDIDICYPGAIVCLSSRSHAQAASCRRRPRNRAWRSS